MIKKKFNLLILLAVAASFILSAPLAAKEEKDEQRHPSYNLLGRDKVSEESPLNPNFVKADESRLSSEGFWRGNYLTERLVGLAAYDIDGDGKVEVAYATVKNVVVAQYEGGNLSPLSTFRVSTTERIISLDALDLTGDGRMELIVSCQNDKGEAASKILSYQGKKISELAGKLPWYLRVVGSPEGRFLAGQKGSTEFRQAFSGGVVRLSLSGRKLSSQGTVSLPSGINLFNFTQGRMGSSGAQMTAAVKFPNEHLYLYEGDHKAWESRDEYAGTVNYVQGYSTDTATVDKEFIPARVLIADIDRDGQNELIVAKNDRGGVAFMSNLRAFNGGVIEAFKFVNLSLSPEFRTRRLPGAAVDYQVADFNNNGTLDLVVAVVIEQGSGMWEDARSIIVAYEIGQAKDEYDQNTKKKSKKKK